MLINHLLPSKKKVGFILLLLKVRDKYMYILMYLFVYLVAEREREKLASQKTAETVQKTETNGQEKPSEASKQDAGQADLKEQNTFNALVGETSFDIPIFSEEFLNYNRSKFEKNPQIQHRRFFCLLYFN